MTQADQYRNEKDTDKILGGRYVSVEKSFVVSVADR